MNIIDYLIDNKEQIITSILSGVAGAFIGMAIARILGIL